MCYVLQEGVKLKGGNSNPGSRSERIPLVFGVSGHRDLVPADLPKLHEQLRSIFTRFRAAYPTTPFNLLTPLAEGADRLAGRSGPGSRHRALGAITNEAARNMSATSRPLSRSRNFGACSPRPILIGKFPLLAILPAMQRTRQYAEVGEFIARSSHVLILLWDGGDNKKDRRHRMGEKATRPLGRRGVGPVSWRRSTGLRSYYSGCHATRFREGAAPAPGHDR